VQGCEQAMAVMLAKLPTRPFAGMTQIRFKGFGLRHLSPHGTPLGSAMLYDIHFLITIPAAGEFARLCDTVTHVAKNSAPAYFRCRHWLSMRF
jgi:hypothetical protein